MDSGQTGWGDGEDGGEKEGRRRCMTKTRGLEAPALKTYEEVITHTQAPRGKGDGKVASHCTGDG